MEPMMLLAALMFALPAAGFVVLLKRLTATRPYEPAAADGGLGRHFLTLTIQGHGTIAG